MNLRVLLRLQREEQEVVDALFNKLRRLTAIFSAYSMP